MVRILTDNDFNGKIVRGLLRKRPGFDLVRVQDEGLADTPDPDLLEWAARNDRIILTHDRNTMAGFAYARVAARTAMPGVLIVNRAAQIGRIIEDLLLIDAITPHSEWANRVEYLPL
jgi:predicted nuclease of predicted toxin-antitoxin system